MKEKRGQGREERKKKGSEEKEGRARKREKKSTLKKMQNRNVVLSHLAKESEK